MCPYNTPNVRQDGLSLLDPTHSTPQIILGGVRAHLLVFPASFQSAEGNRVGPAGFFDSTGACRLTVRVLWKPLIGL